MDSTSENIQASDIVKFVTEKIEFIKNINMNIADNIDNVLLTDAIKTPIIQELEILRNIIVPQKDRKIMMDTFIIIKSITNQIDILDAISALQQKNKHHKLETLIKRFIGLVNNELNILNEIDLKYQEGFEKELDDYFKKFNEIVAKELEIMMRIMPYNIEDKKNDGISLMN